MPKATVSDEVFRQMFMTYGGAETARKLGILERNVFRRRERLEKRSGEPIPAPFTILQERVASHKARRSLSIRDGIALAISDQHYWPGIISTAHAGAVKFCQDYGKDLKALIWDGDAFDGAKVGRHARIAWEYQPDPADELDAVKDRSRDFEEATDADKIWLLGNHDARFETYFAVNAPAMERVEGVHLKDHLPAWKTGWSLFVNDSVVFKHRFKGGIHAGFNNALWSGKSMVSGHTHKGVVYPLTNYAETLWGVELPVGAEPNGPQFMDYTEDNPKNWRSGFAVFTFIDGVMCQPELAFVVDVGVIEFRGQRIRV